MDEILHPKGLDRVGKQSDVPSQGWIHTWSLKWRTPTKIPTPKALNSPSWDLRNGREV
jgi:hypothetical protein